MQQQEAAGTPHPSPCLAQLGGAQHTVCPEYGSLSAFQICRMITSVSVFTALIPPTCGLTHVAVTVLPGYWYERREREAAAARSTRLCLHKLSCAHQGKVGGNTATEGSHLLRGCGKAAPFPGKAFALLVLVVMLVSHFLGEILEGFGGSSLKSGCGKHPAMGHPGQSKRVLLTRPLRCAWSRGQFGDFRWLLPVGTTGARNIRIRGRTWVERAQSTKAEPCPSIYECEASLPKQPPHEFCC